MTREEYINNVRNNNTINLVLLFETLQLNPTFKIKDYGLFMQYLNIFQQNPFHFKNVNNILKKEMNKLLDIKYEIHILEDKQGNEILIL